MLPTGDLLLVLATAVLLFAPGGAVLAIAGWARPVRWPVLLGAAPLVTAGLSYVATLVTHAVGLPYGLPTFLIFVGIVVVGAALGVRLLRGRRRMAARPPQGKTTPSDTSGVCSDTEDAVETRRWWQRHLTSLLGLVATAVASAISIDTWGRGLGRLSVVPQEHDTITHTLITAYIARSGNGAPGDSYPVDLLSGTPDAFYPEGFHALAALVADAGVDPVTAMNATMLAVFAFAAPLGLFALGSLLRLNGLEHLAGGGAAVVGVLAYRPTYALMHDGGVLATAIAMALAPGAVATILVLMNGAPGRTPGRREEPPRIWRRIRLPDVVVSALVMSGAFAIHPTSAALVGLGVVAWRVGDLVTNWPGWPVLGSWLLTVGAAALITIIGALPILVQVLGSAGTVSTWPRDLPVIPIYQSLGIGLGMPYGGFLDPAIELSQPLLAGLSLLGVVYALVTRQHGGLLLAWLAWLIVLMNFLSDVSLPVLTTVANLFYNSYVRISGALAPFQWLLAGLALASVGKLLAVGLLRVLRQRGPSRRPLTRHLAPVLAFALVLTLAVLSADSIQTNTFSVEKRYAQPDFFRLDDDDRAAIDFLAENVEAGDRVMNNANDGSTFLYVYEDIPVVEIAPLGVQSIEYTQDLLADFNQLDDDQRIQDLVRELNIRWVYVDSEAPAIGSPPEVYPWWGEPSYSTPPGFENLDDVSSLSEVFTEGSVSVYRVSDEVFDE